MLPRAMVERTKKEGSKKKRTRSRAGDKAVHMQFLKNEAPLEILGENAGVCSFDERSFVHLQPIAG